MTKNIHILPTDKPSRLHKYDYLSTMGLSKEPLQWRLGRNIYITSDEEIKEGDWVLANYDVFKILKEDAGLVNKELKLFGIKTYFKIILTTDQDLIKDGVQAIDDEFLEWFVKNPSCDEVNVKNPLIANVSDFGYKIIIPKEEPKTEYRTCKCGSNWFNTTVADKPFCFKCGEVVKEDFNKKETLEEVSTNYANKNFSTKDPVADEGWYASWLGFRNGAKWQQERMYSEEDMKKAFNSSSLINMLDVYDSFEEFMQQFKKK